MNGQLDITPASDTYKQIRQLLRKSSWLIDQARLLAEQQQLSLEDSNNFARNLADVQRHLVATTQTFCKPKSNADRSIHDEHASQQTTL